LLVLAVAMAFNIGSFPALAEQVSRDLALIFLSGILLLVAGLAIVRAHNVWIAGWPVLVTIIGWIAIVSGIARMLFPNQLAAMAVGFSQSTGWLIAWAVLLLVLGGFLTFKAYSRD
jgi:hypothetical protein